MELQKQRIADLDIFADDVAEVLDQAKAAGAAQPGAGAANPALQDNYDDAEGYYNFQVGSLSFPFEVLPTGCKRSSTRRGLRCIAEVPSLIAHAILNMMVRRL